MNKNEIIDKLKRKDVRAVARLLTLIENEEKEAENILKEIWNSTGNSYIIGITLKISPTLEPCNQIVSLKFNFFEYIQNFSKNLFGFSLPNINLIRNIIGENIIKIKPKTS